MQDRVRNLIIVGGGTAGWMVAASLRKYLRAAQVNITLVESSAIGTVGVGEATIPSIRRFYADLDLLDAQVISATNATCKLGIHFEGWHAPGKNIFHPFGLFGQDIRQTGFQHFWNKLRMRGRSALSRGIFARHTNGSPAQVRVTGVKPRLGFIYI